MSFHIKFSNNTFEAGQIIENIIVKILDYNNKVDIHFINIIKLNIINIGSKKNILSFENIPLNGIVIFTNIILNKIGLYNFIFNSNEIIYSKQIKIIPSSNIKISYTLKNPNFYKNNINNFNNFNNEINEKVNEKTENNLYLKLKDIYDNELPSYISTTIKIKTDNPDIYLFGSVVYYNVSIFIDSNKNEKYFLFNNNTNINLSFELGNTYVFNIQLLLEKNIDFNLKSDINDNSNNNEYVYGVSRHNYLFIITISKKTNETLYYFSKKNNDIKPCLININLNDKELKTFTLKGGESLLLPPFIFPETGTLSLYIIGNPIKNKNLEISNILINIHNFINNKKIFLKSDLILDNKTIKSSELLETTIINTIQNNINETLNLITKKNGFKLNNKEGGLTETQKLNYLKNKPQELSTMYVKVDNTMGGTQNNEPYFNPRLKPTMIETKNNDNDNDNDNKQDYFTIQEKNKMGLTSGTLINMNKQESIYKGPKLYVINDILSLQDILNLKKVNNDSSVFIK